MARRRVSLPELDRLLEIDDSDNRLYWNNKLVHTEAVVALSGKQSIVFIIAALATILSAVSTFTYTWYYVTDYNTKKNQKEITSSISEVIAVLQNISSRIPANFASAPSTTPSAVDPDVKRSLVDIANSLQDIRNKLSTALPIPASTPSSLPSQRVPRGK